MFTLVALLSALCAPDQSQAQSQTQSRSGAQAGASAPAANPAIEAQTLSAHVHFLASDEMKGRMTGSPETKVAAHYIADVLEEAGVEPAGDEGTFFQRVPLLTYSFSKEPTLLVEEADGTTWTAMQGTDFRLRVRGAPDAARKLAVYSTDNIPEESAARDMALFLPGRRTEVSAWLTEHGHGDGSGLGLVLLEGSKRQGRPRPMRNGGLANVPQGPDPADQLIVNERLLEGISAGRVVSVTLSSNATVEDRSCQNVVGILRGKGPAENPELADQAIVLTAHYDHIGHREEQSEEQAEGVDTINNGADDDASGVAAVLELAEAFGAEDPPARTIVFVLVTGEERGLLGTEVYLNAPPIPLEQTLYNLNVEMIGRPDDLMPGPGDLWLTGWNETTLGPSLAGEGQPVHEDPRPEQNFYERSDNIAFVRRGIMGQTLSSFGMHTDYHRVTDEADTLDYEHMEKATKNVLRVARALAVDGIAVDWGKKEDR